MIEANSLPVSDAIRILDVLKKEQCLGPEMASLMFPELSRMNTPQAEPNESTEPVEVKNRIVTSLWVVKMRSQDLAPQASARQWRGILQRCPPKELPLRLRIARREIEGRR